MTAQHFADVELDADGNPDVVRFVCSGGPDDECHQWCAEGCEEQCYGGDLILTGAKHPINLWRPVDAHRWAPMPPDGTRCRIAEWLGACGWQDTGWVDDEKVGDREVTPADLRPGRHLIEDEWTGDDYIWRYPAVEVAS